MLLGSRAVQAPFGLSTQLGSWIPQSWPRSAALSLTVPCEKLTAWLSGTRQGHEKLGKVVLGQVIRQTHKSEAFRRGGHLACGIREGFSVGRREQSFHLMLVPRFLQSPRKMGLSPLQVAVQPGLAATCRHLNLELYLV